MRFKTSTEIEDIRQRFIYEQALGKSLRAYQWRQIAEVLKASQISLNDENLQMFAEIHKLTGKYPQEATIPIIKDFLDKCPPGQVAGIDILSAVKEICLRKFNDLPSNPTIYRWFGKTSAKGYKAKQLVYSKIDFCSVLVSALNYQPKEN
jgi:hypothetical protein